MEFIPCEARHATSVTTLFTQVFTDSEGVEEGRRIGGLVHDIQATTPPEEVWGFLAMDETRVVGGIFFTRMTFETESNAFLLAPVAVATEFHNQGIGQKLIRFGLEALRKQGVKLIFTYGDPHFYAKVGFQPISEAIVQAPLPLTYPHGWLAQSLVGERIEPIAGRSACVSALRHPHFW